MRIFQPSTSYAETPEYDVDLPYTKWTAPNIGKNLFVLAPYFLISRALGDLVLEDDLNSFSAVCALFGANLADSLGARPIGVVDISWGETAIEAWASPNVLATCDVPPVPW